MQSSCTSAQRDRIVTTGTSQHVYVGLAWFRIPGPLGHTPRNNYPSRQPWTPQRYNMYNVPGEGSEGLAAHPRQSAVRFLINLCGSHQGNLFLASPRAGATRGPFQTYCPVLLDAEAAAGRGTATQLDHATQSEHAVRMRVFTSGGCIDASDQSQRAILCDGYPRRGVPPCRGDTTKPPFMLAQDPRPNHPSC